MCNTARHLSVDDPCVELALRWPDWKVNPRPLDGIPEVWSVARQTVLLDEGWHARDPEMAMAHVLAHLELGHHLRMPLSPQDEDDADGLAMLRLGRMPEWWPEIDGEPTQSALEPEH